MKENRLIYLIAFAAAFIVKTCCGAADSDALTWILAPVSWCVKILGGISFEYVSHVGYVSHAYRFIIAPSCSGVRFLILTFLMLIVSFTHLLQTQKKKVFWFAFSVGFSYLATVIVNAIRITISIYLPILLTEKGLLSGALTAQRLHTMIGTAVYFSSLFVIYFLAGKICTKIFGAPSHEKSARRRKYLGIPIFWYAATVLVLPFLSRIYHDQWEGFGQYALLVTGICVVIALFFALITRRAEV